MTCTAIYGNGARTIGWTITLPLREIAILIKTKTVTIALPAEDRGMSLRISVAAPHGCEYYSLMRTSLWDFGWRVMLSLETKL